MSFQGNRNNLSIDVNNNRPTPLNMLMQQSMEVLTKMVTRKLQDSGKIPYAKGPIQISFESKGLSIEGDESPELAIDDLSLDGDSDKELIHLDNESNYHVRDSDAKKCKSETESDGEAQNLELNCELDDSELHLDEEEGDIIFDYGTQEITGTPNEIGEHITQMLESALPNGFEHDGQGRLHAVVNGDELTITEQEFAEAMSSLQKIQTMKHRKQPTQPHGSIEAVSENDTVEEEVGDLENIEHYRENHLRGQEKPLRSHQQGHLHAHSNVRCNEERQAESPKTRRRHDYDYPPTTTRRAPNFAALLNEKRPLCLFCEYYMVFGEPPRNMIKWYNSTYEYDSLPRKKESQHNHHRKRNR